MSKSELTPIEHNLQLILNRAGLHPPNGPIIAGVSGGVDSMVMLYGLVQSGFTVHVVHINYHKRGLASDEDATLVSSYASSLGAQIANFDIWPQDLDSGNFQDAARNARHRIFRHEMDRVGAQAIALGHNMNDKLETILMRILRGSAPSNWDGIVEYNPPIVRPILLSTREEITAFAQSNNIPWREDSSNASSHYARNLLRNDLIPAMDSLLPGWMHNIDRIMDYGSTYAQALDAILGDDVHSSRISISKLIANPELLQNALIHRFLELREISVSHSVISEIVQLLRSQSGKFIELNKELAIYKEGDFLVIDALGISESISMIIPVIESSTPALTTSAGTFCSADIPSLSGTKIDLRNPDAPITLRTWMAGDRIHLESGGTKKISDLITDWKIPLRLKSSVFVLTLDETLIACIFAHPSYPTRYRIASEWDANSTSSNVKPISIYLNH